MNAIAGLDLDLDLGLFTLLEDEIAPHCQHQTHSQRHRGHNDETPVWAVEPLELDCCGYRGTVQYLCQGWIQRNPTLRCSRCGVQGIPFEDCYRLLGPV